MTAATASVATALAAVQRDISRASDAAGRREGDVRLVAASKTVAPESLEVLLNAGHMTFGENRVQEAVQKWPGLRRRWPDIELHLIGPLQSNKVRTAVEHFDVVQSLDRLSLCTALAREIGRLQRAPRLFVQVNIGDEPQKSGVPTTDLRPLLRACRSALSFDVAGLMCIPPAGRPPAPYFRRLCALADEYGLAERSMGMSGDYEEAVRHGATVVRVGSAIFGRRPPAPEERR